jgi:hypothetical protein
MRKALVSAACAAWLLAANVSAQERIGYLCYGEFPRDNCPANTTVFGDCDTKYKEAAKAFCTIETKDGPAVVPHFVDFIDQKHGNHCGYNWFKITCRPDQL